MLLLILLLIVSGTVEVNPGPAQRSIKYPCGTCEQSVYTGKSIACDSCNCWFHLQCTEMSEQMFDCYTQNVNLEWLCLKCGMPDINSTIFDSSISSEESSSEISTKIKAKMLRIMIVNFQGIWSKKEFFENCLLNSNADVVIGSETFLDPSIKNAEFLPPGFTAYRQDRDNG